MRRGGVAILFALLCCTWSPSQAAVDHNCTAAGFEFDARATLDACSWLLNNTKQTDTERAEALKIRARCLHRLGFLDDAIAEYDAALLLEPKDPELHLRRGWTAYDKRDFTRAIDLAWQALKLRPNYAAAYDLIGAVFGHIEVSEFAKAKASFDEAIRLEPEEPLFRYHRYEVRPSRTFPAEALHELDELLRLPAASITKPASLEYFGTRTSFRVAASIERGKLLTRLGRIEEASRAHDQAVLDDPGALTFAWRAQFNLSQGASEKVVQADLDRSLALDPNVWFSRNVQGRVHFYGDRFDAAAAEFARAIELNPLDGNLRWWRARTLRKLGRFDEAADEALTAFRVDFGFMQRQIPMLRTRGYLGELRENADPVPALADATRACMLDEGCW